MDLKNRNIDITTIFDYNRSALGTDAELPMSNLISIACDLSDDNELLKLKLDEIKKLSYDTPNNYDFGEKVRQIIKDI